MTSAPPNYSGHSDSGTARVEKGFCAVLQQGETHSMDTSNIGELCQMIEGASIAWVDYIIEDFNADAPKVAATLGFNETLVTNLLRNPRSGYDDLGDQVGIMLPAMIVKGFNVKLNPLLILFRENVIVTLHNTEIKRFSRVRRYAENLMKKLSLSTPQKDRVTILLTRIIDENNARNFDYLREIEEQGDNMSEELADPKTPRNILGPKIHQMKHALIIYLGGLWATVDALDSLRYGDADLISDDPKYLNKLSALLSEVNVQIGLAEHLSEVLASGLEVLQSIYNNQLQILNNRLAFVVAYLTIIGTALLVPNTIATVAGNSMFGFTSKDVFPYLLLIIISTIGATIFSWFAVRWMGLLPKSPE